MKMKKILVLLLVFAPSIFAKENQLGFVVLSHDDRMQLQVDLCDKKLDDAYKVYKYCFMPKRGNTKDKDFKIKLKQFIEQNINALKLKYDKPIIEYCYINNSSSNESKYFKRKIIIDAIRLLGGTTCRCCIPPEVLQAEKYFIITGKNMDDEARNQNSDELNKWLDDQDADFNRRIYSNLTKDDSIVLE